MTDGVNAQWTMQNAERRWTSSCISHSASSLLSCLASCAPVLAPAPVVTAPRFPDFLFPAAPASLASTELSLRQQRGWQFLQAGDVRGARREFNAALKVNPAFYPADAGLAYASLAERDFPEAVEPLRPRAQTIRSLRAGPCRQGRRPGRRRPAGRRGESLQGGALRGSLAVRCRPARRCAGLPGPAGDAQCAPGRRSRPDGSTKRPPPTSVRSTRRPTAGCSTGNWPASSERRGMRTARWSTCGRPRRSTRRTREPWCRSANCSRNGVISPARSMPTRRRQRSSPTGRRARDSPGHGSASTSPSCRRNTRRSGARRR